MKSAGLLFTLFTCCAAPVLAADISTSYINLFKGVTPQKGDFEVVFNHRFFSPIADSKASDWYGLDSGAHVGYGVNYGLTQKLAVGIYRTTLLKTYNATLMYNLLDDRHEWASATEKPESGAWGDKAAEPQKDIVTLGVRAGYSWVSLVEREGNYSVNTEITLSKQFLKRFSLAASLIYTSNATGMDANTAFWRANSVGFGVAAEVLIWGNLFALAEFNIPFVIWSNRYATKSLGLSYQTFGHDFKLFVTNSTATTAEAMQFSQVADVRIAFSIARVF